MKKMFVLLLIGFIVMIYVPVSEADEVICTRDIDSLREEYLENDEFSRFYRNDPVEAMNFLHRELDRLHELNDAGLRSEVFYDNSVSTSLIQQIDGITCGPASALMALKGCGYYDQVTGSSDYWKVYNLALQMHTFDHDETWVEDLYQGLNDYLPYYKYDMPYATNWSLNTFRSYVQTSLIYSRIPILHSVTSYLGYYNGNTYYHFIPIQRFNGPNSTMTLYDGINNPSFYGVHVVSDTAAYNSIHAVSGRCLICYH